MRETVWLSHHTIQSWRGIMIRTLEEREKRAIRRSKGIKKPYDLSVVNGGVTLVAPKVRTFYAPMKSDYRPPKLRGRSGTRLSSAIRQAMALREAAREAFFASLSG
jgi:hypothetical protein